VHAAREPALPPTRASVVRAAKMFRGLPYLWAGTSGFGFDCSGLTSLVYRVHGISIPRDSSPQSENGADAPRPRPGDLQFYATDGKVHHVSMYLGRGRMVHSPGTGQTVEVIATSTPGYAEEYAGARRYLP
jgi:cell wall-associated NlpC family hydrolase